MTKRLFWMLMLALLAIGINACSDNENTPAEPAKPVEASYNTSATGGSTKVDFTAGGSWRAASSQSWAKVTPQSGNAGNVSITIDVASNETSAERTAEVTVTTGAYNQTICRVTVKQEGKQGGVEPDPEPEPDPAIFDPLKPEEEEHETVGNMSSDAAQIVANITVGWNLGNTCESDGVKETDWDNPMTSQELITTVKNAGFNAVRVPVRWYRHADADFTIDEAWLARVAEIIDYCINEDMYVIINSHHDNWYDRLPVGYNATEIKEKFAKMWTQIARYYRDYDEHLIFAGVNEMISLNADKSENWGKPTNSQQNLLNDLQQIFVTRVRATGGNNATRCLMIQGWACNTDFVATTTFKMPKDRVEGRLIYDFHQYAWTYSTEAAGKDNKYFWGEPYKDYTPWFSNGESELDWRYGELEREFINKGYPVIMSEFGCVQHNKSGNDEVADQSRAYYHEQVVGRAKQHGIKAFYWDNGVFGSKDGENFGIIDRKTNTVPARAQIALDGIMAGRDW